MSAARQPLIDLDRLPPAEAMRWLEGAGERLETPSGDGTIVWRTWGEGPALVLLRGGYGSWAHWIKVVQPLARDFRVLVPDMPGFGHSADPPEPYSADSIAAILSGGLDEIVGGGAPRAIAWFSFGGVIAGHLAAQQGPRVSRLVLVGAGGLGAKRGEVPELIARTPDMSPAEVEAAHRRNLEILMLADPRSIDEFALQIQVHNTRLHRVKSRPISATDTLARVLEKVPAHLGAIWGGRDATAGRYLDQREEILRAIKPTLEFRVIPEAGHWVMYEAPELFVAELRSILP